MNLSDRVRALRTLACLSLWLFLLTSIEAQAQPGLVKLGHNTFPFAADQSTILTPVLAEVTAAQVLFVGELDHGDGSAHPLKLQLLKQLHQQHPNLAVVFEADFFALNHRAQSRTLKERLGGLYTVWTECAQFQPVEQYLLDHQVPVYGTDVQLVMPYSQQHLVPYLDSLLPAHPHKAPMLQVLKTLQEKQYGAQTPAEQKEQFLATLYTFQAQFKAGFDGQLLRTIEAFARHEWQGLLPKHPVYYRDQGMGENLFWLKSTLLPTTQVVFFGANSHIGNTRDGHEKTALTTVKAAFDAHQVYSSYALAMIAYRGVAKRPTMPNSFPIPPYPGQGLEQSLYELSLPFALVNLRAPDLRDKKFGVRGFEHDTKHKLPWSQVYDAFLYSQEVVPCGPMTKEEE